MKTTQETLQEINDKLSVLLGESGKIAIPDTPKLSETNIEEPAQDTDSKFVKRRLTFVVAGTLLFMFTTYLMYLNFLPLFNISFGLMLAFICMFLVIAFDEFILPGDTIGKISQSAIASSIVILSFAVIIIGGAQIGSGLITSRTQGEEPTQERVTISTPSRTIKADSGQVGFDKTADQGTNSTKAKEQ